MIYILHQKKIYLDLYNNNVINSYSKEYALTHISTYVYQSLEHKKHLIMIWLKFLFKLKVVN